MKKLIFILCISFFWFNAFTQNEKEIKVKTDIESVIVYLDGAEIHQSKSVTLTPGKTTVIFEGLSPKLNSSSIQVTVSNDVSILAISDKINYLTKVDEKPRIKQLKDSVELLNEKITSLNDETDAYNVEKAMLLRNESIGGQNNGVPMTELKIAADFYRDRIKDINSKISQINQKINDYNITLNKLNNQLYELNAQYSYTRAEVSVLLSTENAVAATVDLRYLVSDAGWAASYDLKADDIDKPVELIYRAKVYNNTNIDWKDVKLKLSTADPTRSAAQPKMNTWYLNYETENENYNYGYINKEGIQYNAAPMTKQDFGLVQQQTLELAPRGESLNRNIVQKGNVNYEVIEVSELSAEFDIKKEYSIPSDSKPYLVDVIEHKLPATYKHYCIPKVDRDAFLLARITGWEDLDLVEGPANVYFGGTYIGQSYIYTRNVNDTLDLSFGRDKKVIVTRTKQKDFSSTQFASGKRKVTYAFEMIIKNNRKVPVQIEVQDQLPISQNSEIEVDVINISNAERDELTGKLVWKFNLTPDKTEKVNLSFFVKYPKNRTVKLKQTRTLNCPSF